MELNELLDVTRRNIALHTNKFSDLVQSDGGKLFTLDMLVFGSLNRSHSLLSGFVSLIENGNFVCAAPLVRMQLDNALRLFAAWLVEKPHDFAHSVLKGMHIRSIKDRNNNKMTDRYLAQEMNEKHTWVLKLYEESSGFVHLSSKHIFSSISNLSKLERTVSFEIGVPNSAVPQAAYIEAVAAINASTELFFEYVDGWILTKDNPDLIENARRAASANI